MNILSLLAAVSAENIGKALDIMWKGVVAIFIVIALVIIVTKLVNKACVTRDILREEKEREKNEKSQNENENQQ